MANKFIGPGESFDPGPDWDAPIGGSGEGGFKSRQFWEELSHLILRGLFDKLQKGGTLKKQDGVKHDKSDEDDDKAY